MRLSAASLARIQRPNKNHEEPLAQISKGKNIELSLRDLLKYSGLDSLEARNKQAQGTATGPPTYRQSGAVIEIQINYDNRRRLDGRKVQAEATVKYRDIGWSSFGAQRHHFERSDDRTATEYYHSGVRVVVVPTGSIGQFDLYLFLGVIAQFIVYLAIASCRRLRVNWLLGDRSIDQVQDSLELTHHKPESWAARMASPTDGADQARAAAVVLARGAGPPHRARPGPREGAALGRIRRRGLPEARGRLRRFREGPGRPGYRLERGPRPRRVPEDDETDKPKDGLRTRRPPRRAASELNHPCPDGPFTALTERSYISQPIFALPLALL